MIVLNTDYLSRFTVLVLTSFVLIGCASSRSVGSFESAAATSELFEDEERLWALSEEDSERFRMASLYYEDPKLNAYLQEINDSLFPDFPEKLIVKAFNSSDLNAFAMPNGNIFVNIGLLARMENEAQLAAVLAHEGVHYIQRHSVKQNRSAKSTFFVGSLFGVLGQVFAYSSIAGYSRTHETESDTLGFERLYNAGYKVEEGGRFFAKVARENLALESKQPFFFASHPRMEERAKNFENLAKNKNNPDGLLGVEKFREVTLQATLDALQEELSKGNEKLLRFILEEEDHLQHLPLGSRFYLGEAYRIRGEEKDVDRAVEEYKKTILEAPEYAPPYSALGLMQMKSNDKEQAIQNFNTYLTLAPEAKNSGYVRQYLDQLKGQE